MPSIVDPLNALVALQEALDECSVVMRRCDLHPELAVYLDHPLGSPRFTYAVVVNGRVQAIALLTPAERIEGIPCFQIGYAVIESMRSRGLAKRTALHAIDELRNGLQRNGVGRFYVEAIVSKLNVASNAVARQILSEDPSEGTDEHSGE